MPNSTNKASNLGLQTNRTYGVKSNTRGDLIGRLDGTISPEGTSWTQEIVPANLQEKGVTAKGAVDLPIWVNSWNHIYGGTADELQISDEIEGTTAPGYVIGKASDTLTKDSVIIYTGNTSGYNNTLYYPRKSLNDYVRRYWVASYTAFSGWEAVSIDHREGYVCHTDCRYDICGTRPIVYIPSNIRLKLVDGVYEVVD